MTEPQLKKIHAIGHNNGGNGYLGTVQKRRVLGASRRV
ncbi:MAG: hypothetical protein ACJAUP_002850 [Cellvibrionaceae bacterium]|jgi:hypothetical protein